MQWDLSYTYGAHHFHFYVNDSLNRSLGLESPLSFDSGATSYQLLNNLTLTAGINNIFNTMPAKWGETSLAFMGTGKTFEYSQFAPFGYNGTEYYLGAQLQF